ncbi:hypothetical protein GBP346_B2178 [Burkholderia pseudomallei MSHR346]|nr:hypothetical protein GBP346_B2178 [Burkholderia pseudomallei MSHR346]
MVKSDMVMGLLIGKDGLGPNSRLCDLFPAHSKTCAAFGK